MKFNPQVLEGQGLQRIADLIRGYFKMGGHHIQFNVITAEARKEAQLNPQLNRDLIVRVAGYSDYFVDIGRQLQDEIIARTEHALF